MLKATRRRIHVHIPVGSVRIDTDLLTHSVADRTFVEVYKRDKNDNSLEHHADLKRRNRWLLTEEWKTSLFFWRETELLVEISSVAERQMPSYRTRSFCNKWTRASLREKTFIGDLQSLSCKQNSSAFTGRKILLY